MFYTVLKYFLKFVSYIFFPVKVHGDVHAFPKDEPVVLCANHISFFDVVFLMIIFERQIRFVGKQKYINHFILKYPAKWIGAFGIDTTKPDLNAIKNCFKVLKKNEVLGIFPEGTRIIGDKVSDPMPGATMIAHKSKSNIFYIRIKPSAGRFKIFRRNDIYIGGLIQPQNLGITNGKGDEYKNASINLMNLIYGLGEK